VAKRIKIVAQPLKEMSAYCAEIYANRYAFGVFQQVKKRCHDIAMRIKTYTAFKRMEIAKLHAKRSVSKLAKILRGPFDEAKRVYEEEKERQRKHWQGFAVRIFGQLEMRTQYIALATQQRMKDMAKEARELRARQLFFEEHAKNVWEEAKKRIKIMRVKLQELSKVCYQDAKAANDQWKEANEWGTDLVKHLDTSRKNAAKEIKAANRKMYLWARELIKKGDINEVLLTARQAKLAAKRKQQRLKRFYKKVKTSKRKKKLRKRRKPAGSMINNVGSVRSVSS